MIYLFTILTSKIHEMSFIVCMMIVTIIQSKLAVPSLKECTAHCCGCVIWAVVWLWLENNVFYSHCAFCVVLISEEYFFSCCGRKSRLPEGAIWGYITVRGYCSQDHMLLAVHSLDELNRPGQISTPPEVDGGGMKMALKEVKIWCHSVRIANLCHAGLANVHLLLSRMEFSWVHTLQGALAQLSCTAMSSSPVC